MAILWALWLSHPNHAERGTAEPRTPTTPNEKKRARDMAFCFVVSLTMKGKIKRVVNNTYACRFSHTILYKTLRKIMGENRYAFRDY